MGWLPPELNNESFQVWLDQEKRIDRPITWTSAAPRVNLDSVEVLNNVFTDPLPRLGGWIHEHGFAFNVLYERKVRLVRADYKGHTTGYRDPCSNELLGPVSHIHWFDETCPRFEVRRPFPPELSVLGNDPIGVLSAFLKLLNISHVGVTPYTLPAKQVRLENDG